MFLASNESRLEKYQRGWTSGGKETPCGFGSKLENTTLQRQWLPLVVKKYGIRTVADIGAGDCNWIKHIIWGVRYSAYDLVPRCPRVIEFDLLYEVPPKVDALLCLWVLNHLTETERNSAVDNLLASGSKYLFITDRAKWNCIYPRISHIEPAEVLRLNDAGDSIKMIRCEAV